ncbi:MAG: hypothetical protein ACT4OO_07790 [Nitrospiraceae bacterium]
MTPVAQEEMTGCGIASVAAVAGVSYSRAKEIAHSLGISAHDRKLWSDTAYVRRLLARVGVRAAHSTSPFQSWSSLPDLALLAIKWRVDRGRPLWHWVVFVRENGHACVWDSKKTLVRHRRTDFGRMKPKWYLTINPS